MEFVAAQLAAVAFPRLAEVFSGGRIESRKGRLIKIDWRCLVRGFRSSPTYWETAC